MAALCSSGRICCGTGTRGAPSKGGRCMNHRNDRNDRTLAAVLVTVAAVTAFAARPASAGSPPPLFSTSDRCVACHNGMTTPSGEDVSIGFAWRASIMANAARDPYWQAAVRREAVDYPAAAAVIQNECAACH